MKDERLFDIYQSYMLATGRIKGRSDDVCERARKSGAARIAMGFWKTVSEDVRKNPGGVRRTLLNHCGCSEDEIADLEGGCGWPRFFIANKQEDLASTEVVHGETVIVKPRSFFDREYYDSCIEKYEDPAVQGLSDEEFAEYCEAVDEANLEWFESDADGDASEVIPEEMAEAVRAWFDSPSIIVPEWYANFTDAACNVSRQPIFGDNLQMVCNVMPPTGAEIELAGNQIIIGDVRRFAESVAHANNISLLATADGGVAMDIEFTVAMQ